MVAAVAVIALGGCAVRGESTFREVDPAAVPFGLGATTSTSTTTTTTTLPPTTTSTTVPRTTPPSTLPPSTTSTVAVSTTTTSTTIAPTFQETLYFVRDGKLVPVVRTRTSQPDLQGVAGDLTAGALPTDVPPGLRSVVKPEHLQSVDATAGVARVNLTAEFIDRLPTGEQQLAIAQLVYTLTAQPGIGQVVFEVGGTPIDVPRSDGSLATGRITRDDLPGVLAPSKGS